MQWLFIGSVAAKHWWPEFRTPRDIDILTPLTLSGSNSQICMVETSWHDAASLIIDANSHSTFADPDMLFTIKVSHAEWNIKWEKTMHDIAFMQRLGCKLLPEVDKALVKVWQQVHGKKKVNMARSMDTFFNDAVKREHDHEHLHELVAFNGRPMHERLREDHSTAWCSVERFNALTSSEQAETALEEILATAIERGKLTTSHLQSQKTIAVNQAYFKLVTSMTTGWFARYLILNRNHLLCDRRTQWMNKLNSALMTLQLSQ